MAATSPIGFDIGHLREQVRATYTRVAQAPDGEFHFHRGPRYAADYLGYDRAELRGIPRAATDRFAGVGNPLMARAVLEGETVLDHACGAGTDLLLAARRVGPTGRAIGVDMTPAMRASATRAAAEAGLIDRVEIRAGLFEELPVESASVDTVLSNGVLNLSPNKRQVLREVWRVLRPGGHLQLADVVVQRELSVQVRSNPDLWAACIAGALPEYELVELAREIGFVDVTIRGRHQCFADAPAETRVASDLRVAAVTILARKPLH